MYLNCDIILATVEARLKAVESQFRKGFKSYDAARYIVRANRDIPEDEKKAICQEIPIALKTLEGVFTKLRKMGLYPPQETSEISPPTSTLEKPQEASHQVSEVPHLPSQEYVTKEDFNTQFETLRNSTNENLETITNSINNLASLLNQDPPLNLGGEPPLNPGEYDEEDERIPSEERIPPGEMIVQDGGSTREAVFIKPKTRMYYDMSRHGAFQNYPGTREPGPFADFDGSLSDFFNIIVDEFFLRNYKADIGLTMVMPVR